MGENKNAVAVNVTLYPEDLADIDALARIYYHGNRSLALRMIIDFWRANKTPNPLSDEFEDLIDGFLKEQVKPEEFKAQALTLAGGK